MKKSIFGFNVHDIVEISLLCALSIVLDKFVKINVGGTGGSINICMFPLFIISLRHGPFKSFVAGGIVFGFISCLLDGYGLITYPLEYLLSFGSVCILGLFARKINEYLVKGGYKNILFSVLFMVISFISSGVIRTLGATLDSILIYSYEFIPALIYNVSYIVPSLIFVLIIMCLLLPAIKVINSLFPTTYLKK